MDGRGEMHLKGIRLSSDDLKDFCFIFLREKSFWSKNNERALDALIFSASGG
jgi:hypothetical protein